jgi:hypothetical protein
MDLETIIKTLQATGFEDVAIRIPAHSAAMWQLFSHGRSRSNEAFTEPFTTSVGLEFQQRPTFL